MANGQKGQLGVVQKFALVAIALQAVMIALFAVFFEYDVAARGSDSGVGNLYGMFQDVHVMIFIGFGFLMTFLSRHGFGSVGLNFMIAAFVIQWGLFCNCMSESLYEGGGLKHMIVMEDLVKADFSAAAVLISFGAILGRVSPLQLTVIALFELVFYNVNEKIAEKYLVASDAGGSMAVHVFGAYFGLAASRALSRGRSFLEPSSTKTSDMFAMIGTCFLWVYWPSFTGALCTGPQKYRVVVNTLLALSASCFAGFGFSALFRPDRKFNMVDIQNATLAGGVAMGTACNLAVQPWGALSVGFVAAAVSAAGYSYVSPALENRGLFDTCGVHNLHGMPGVIGGLSGIVCALVAPRSFFTPGDDQVYPVSRKGPEQALYQGVALAVVLLLACVSGYVVGMLARLPIFSPVPEGDEYEDKPFWTIEEQEKEGHVTGLLG